MKNLKSIKSIFAQILGTVFLFSCASWNNTEKGVAIGGGTGGAIGAVIGNKSGQAGKGAAIGAVVGGAAGAAIGIYMDKQAKKIEDEVKDAEVERVGESIKLTFDSGILFGFDSYSLTPEAQENIMKFAEILKEYPDTDLSIEGHTDNRGAYEYNLGLSERRAASVKNYLKMQGIDDTRMVTIGYSFDKPVATNETDEGRAKNRRVEILITANDELVEKAEKGEIEN
ncbi:outer membrane protein/peptidoglycan-associated (lipo)protein [Belliella baltica DSM 15883]|uniref:Outer membrane protein/peptidoglycan-associated (Lipo)protein n=1 Tax=Belliella baltica (strain DSM 15883 / CIP 108006 / LMG 21964 / BA134) TaxID=866536 RepID=I3Z6L7_BELBD|nr:OmpA family protein [Belliella baltica]AFL84885.1 outer membrane protein/peptidoglycan-associated (lipo)protein [Belliella baltica DSM 15883]